MFQYWSAMMWDDYVNGFGQQGYPGSDPTESMKEHWFGLENLKT